MHSTYKDQVTPEEIFNDRRRWMAKMGALGAVGATSGLWAPFASAEEALKFSKNTKYAVNDPKRPLTTEKDATSYNNFYEFGTDKSDPVKTAQALDTTNWKVQVGGMVKNPKTFSLNDLMDLAPQEERIYRLRCVEAWSMVIPWVGYSLSHLLNAVQPTEQAKFVVFESVMQPKNMPRLSDGVLDWPYQEGLRLDEAMHPLALLTFGAYGKPLAKQSGAPVRMVLPWKYGFKSAKSLVKITLTDKMPTTSWMNSAPNEYGFYANVNPEVPHPRWTQETERVIGTGLFASRIKSLKFNGYDEVASLYANMDLQKNF